jgi:hypothetical protein
VRSRFHRIPDLPRNACKARYEDVTDL